MTLDDFKGIFWWEYVHRLWGRLIGVVFAVPFFVFLWRRQLPRRLRPSLIGLFALGALQGAVGWWMVVSGLVDDPRVSHYRLAVHLGLAVAIYAWLLWLALDVTEGGDGGRSTVAFGGEALWALGLAAYTFVTILSGAFVAGLDAGLSYNTFPLMGGQIVPAEYLHHGTSLEAIFGNPASVQFHHRVLAVLLVLLVAAYWLAVRRSDQTLRVRVALDGLLATAVIQAGLGIATLLLAVPIVLAAAHQAGALILLGLCLLAARRLATRTGGIKEPSSSS
jgi:cytochrome c oxidase assembly protein subunit 15